MVANSMNRVDSTSDTQTDNTARSVASKRGMGAIEEIFDVYITNLPPILIRTAASNTNKTIVVPTQPHFNPWMSLRAAGLTFRIRTTSRSIPILFFGNRSDVHGSTTQT